jgi:hypothetical protein
MDPVTAILVPSVVGGVLIAFLIAKLQKGGSDSLSNVSVPRSTATDVINISHIRVLGVGGLGLFAMALVVAWFVPRIGQTLGIGVLLGSILGVLMIVRRRRNGPLPSSSGTAGANTIFALGRPAGPDNDDAPTAETSNAQTPGVLCGTGASSPAY